MGFPTLAFAGHRCVSQIMDFTVPERLKDRQMVVKYYSKSGQARLHGGSQFKVIASLPGRVHGSKQIIRWSETRSKCGMSQIYSFTNREKYYIQYLVCDHLF